MNQQRVDERCRCPAELVGMRLLGLCLSWWGLRSEQELAERIHMLACLGLVFLLDK